MAVVPPVDTFDRFVVELGEFVNVNAVMGFDVGDFDDFRCLSYVECVNLVNNDERSFDGVSLVNELRCRLKTSGFGSVGIDANAPIFGVTDIDGVLFSTVVFADGIVEGGGGRFKLIGGLLVTAFFLNNGVNRRCSSKRSIITGCITDDKYERLYRRLSLEFIRIGVDVGLVCVVVVAGDISCDSFDTVFF